MLRLQQPAGNRAVARALDRRKVVLTVRFQAAIERQPGLREVYDRTQPGWRRWLRE